MKIFDICGTIYHSNTTFDFIIYYHRKKNNVYKLLLCYFYSGPLGKVLNRLKLISIRNCMISTLSCEKKDDLNTMSDIFVSEFLTFKKNVKVNSLLRSQCKSDVLLISASIEPVVEAIGRKLNYTSYGSSLQYDKAGYCTGIIDKDLKGKKISIINEKEIELVVTDNRSDIDLINVSQRVIIVSSKAKRNSWIHYLKFYSVDLSRVTFL